MSRLKFGLGIAALLLSLALVARSVAAGMQWDFKLTLLALYVITSALLSLLLAVQRRQLRRRLDRLPPAEVTRLSALSPEIRLAADATPGTRPWLTVGIGVTGVNLPALALMILPIFVLQEWFSVEPPLPQFAALIGGFLLGWLWWSVTVSVWRRWAESRGMSPEEVQYRGEGASILWPEGHFFERTEWRRPSRGQTAGDDP